MITDTNNYYKCRNPLDRIFRFKCQQKLYHHHRQNLHGIHFLNIVNSSFIHKFGLNTTIRYHQGEICYFRVSLWDIFKIFHNWHIKHVVVWLFYYIKYLTFRSRENCLQQEIIFYLLFLTALEYPPIHKLKFIYLITGSLSPLYS